MEPKDEITSLNKEIEMLEYLIDKRKMQIRDAQKRCAHTNTKYWSDPSGNNGGGYECLDCGADL